MNEIKSGLNIVPNSWSWVEFILLADFCNGINFNKDQKGEKGILTVDVLNMYPNGVYVDSSKLYRVDKTVNEDRILKYGDILFVRSSVKREGVGATATFKSHHEPVSFCGFIIRARLKNLSILPEFLTYFFRTPYARNSIVEKGSQVTITNINQDILSNFKIPIAPEREQHRIVSKIEELFSELDKGIEQLTKVQQQLKVYRQAVLKWAFEGKLTKEWREKNNPESADKLLEKIKVEREKRYQQQMDDWKKEVEDWEDNGKKGKKPAKPSKPKIFPQLYDNNIKYLHYLPKQWSWIRFGNLLYEIQAGKSFKCVERPPLKNEVGVAKISAVTWGEYNELESKTCIAQNKINESYFIKDGDFLFSRANTIELVGACVIAKSPKLKVMLSDKTLRFDLLQKNKKYFLYYLRSRFGRDEIESLSTGNQDSMRNIGQDRIRHIRIPLCSLPEQDEIIQQIESRLSVCENIELTIVDALQQSEALKQSILKKAFEGKLVPQDPNDEPASVLLERIKTEKENTEAKPKNQRKKKNK